MGTTKLTEGTRTQQTTPMAKLRSHKGINFFHNNPFTFGFVLDKVLQLEETPVRNPIVHNLPSPFLSYPLKVFHHNFVAVKIGNNIFTDIMVYPSHVTSFSSAYLPKKTLGGKSAFNLEFTSQMFKLPFHLLDLSRIVELSLGSHSEVIYSEVNAENMFLRSTVTGIDLFGKCEQEESSSLLIHSLDTFFDLPSKVFFVARGDSEIKFLPSVEQTKGKNISFKIGISRKVKSHRSTINNGFRFSLFNYTTGLFNTRNRKLGRKGFPQSGVNERMEFDVVPDFIFPRSINAILQSFRIGFNSGNYLWSGGNPYFGGHEASHKLNIDELLYKGNGGWQFLPQLKQGVSLPNVL